MEHGDDFLRECASLVLWKMGEQGIDALVRKTRDDGAE
jgi:hypothetical protein